MSLLGLFWMRLAPFESQETSWIHSKPLAYLSKGCDIRDLSTLNPEEGGSTDTDFCGDLA